MSPRHRGLALLLVSAVGCAGALAFSCAPPARQDARVSSEADLTAIGKIRESYVAAHNDGDATRLIGLWTDDAVFMPMDEPTLTGKEAIRDHFQEFFDQVPSQVAVTADETRVAGDWAFERGTEAVTMEAEQGREAVRMTVKYLCIFQKQTDGSWKYARYIYNLAEALPTPETAPPAR
jgi:uncharacterized protein (TIGR02246 family)